MSMYATIHYLPKRLITGTGRAGLFRNHRAQRESAQRNAIKDSGHVRKASTNKYENSFNYYNLNPILPALNT